MLARISYKAVWPARLLRRYQFHCCSCEFNGFNGAQSESTEKLTALASNNAGFEHAPENPLNESDMKRGDDQFRSVSVLFFLSRFPFIRPDLLLRASFAMMHACTRLHFRRVIIQLRYRCIFGFFSSCPLSVLLLEYLIQFSDIPAIWITRTIRRSQNTKNFVDLIIYIFRNFSHFFVFVAETDKITEMSGQ